MMNTPYIESDTICAVSTPPGVGGIAVVRVSGPSAVDVVGRIWRGARLGDVNSHTAHLGIIVDGEDALDQAVATVFRAPASFTGEDVVEISVHGSDYVQRRLITLLVEAGARIAEPGEFTRRAFVAGKMDLSQAEAVADIIASTSRANHRLAVSQMRGGISRKLAEIRGELLDLASLLELELDFSEEDVEFASRQRLSDLAQAVLDEVKRLSSTFATGSAIKNGIPVAIVGLPNVGKSTLLNYLLSDDRAIVSDIPGTTRDTVEDTADIGGHRFRFIDTAGIRSTEDVVEALGIDRSIAAISGASIVIWLVSPDSGSVEISELYKRIHAAMAADATLIVAINKIDAFDASAVATLRENLCRLIGDYCSESGYGNDCEPSGGDSCSESGRGIECEKIFEISAADGKKLSDITDSLVKIASSAASSSDIIITNARHHQALLDTGAAMTRVLDALRSDLPGDLIALDLRNALDALGSITGSITTPEILSSIFSRFCIGK